MIGCKNSDGFWEKGWDLRLFIGAFARVPALEKLKEETAGFLGGNWTAPENMHLTLRFLGEVEDPAPVIRALEGVAFAPRTLSLRGIGLLGRPAHSLVTKPHGHFLDTLHNKVESALKPLKPGETPRFVPHVTLLRIKERDPSLLRDWINRNLHRETGSLELKLNLVKSVLTPEGPIYETLWSSGTESGTSLGGTSR